MSLMSICLKVDTSLKDGRHKDDPHLPTMLYHQPLTNRQVGGADALRQ